MNASDFCLATLLTIRIRVENLPLLCTIHFVQKPTFLCCRCVATVDGCNSTYGAKLRKETSSSRADAESERAQGRAITAQNVATSCEICCEQEKIEMFGIVV